MKFIYDNLYNKRKGDYSFFKICPKKYWTHYINRKASEILKYNYNFNNPQTFNEKIRWLVSNEKPKLKSILSDKILVKSYVSQKLGPNKTAEIYGIWDKFEEIQFEALPNSFALKANHGWKMNILVKNKRFIYKHYKDLNKLTKEWLKTDFSNYSAEPQYKDIKRKLFAEYLRLETLEDNRYRCDFKVHCFNEEPKFIEICLPLNQEFIGTPDNPSFHDFQFYDCNWQLQPFSCVKQPIKIPQEEPPFLKEMLEYAKILSKGFSYVRIDFSPCKSDLHVVEMSFTPFAALVPFIPANYDLLLGKMIDISKINN